MSTNLELADQAAEAERQKKLKQILEEISASNPFRDIDPIQWQRDMREDRELPFARSNRDSLS